MVKYHEDAENIAKMMTEFDLVSKNVIEGW